MTNENNKYFYGLMECLEKYVEKAGFYIDWEQHRQIANNSVRREDMNGSDKEDRLDYFTGGLCFFVYFYETRKFSPKQFKDSFYKWINAADITAENCPDRLKLVLFGVHEVLEGRSEKLEKERENMKRDIEPDSPEYQDALKKIFSKLPNYLGKELTSGEFNGDAEKGQEVFQSIANSVSPTDYENFHWFPQKEEIPVDSSSVAQEATTELQKKLDRASEFKKEGSPAEIKEIIHELEQFKNNTTANGGKNNYAWQKLSAGEKIASLKIELKMREVRGDDCSDCQKATELQLKLVSKQIELEDAESKNKPSEELEKIKKEIADLKEEITKITSPQQVSSPKNDNTKYWIGGVFLVALLGLIVAIVVERRRIKKKKNGSKR